MLKQSQPRLDLAAILLWFGVLCLYLLTSAAILDNPDARSAYSITRGLVLRGSISIPAADRLDDMFEKAGPDGEVYSKYGLVQSLVQVPLFLVGHWIAPNADPAASQTAVALLNAFTTATALVVLRSIGLKLFGSRPIATGIALIYGIATMAWLYATLTYSEPLLTLILLLAFRVLLNLHNQSVPGVALPALAGLLAGLAILTKYPAVIYVPALLWYVWRAGRGSFRSLAAFVAPLTVGVIALAAYNFVRYGNILDTGYHIMELIRFPRAPWYGAYTLFFSLGKSVFIYAPPLLPAALLLPRFAQRVGLPGRLVIALVLSSLLFYTVVRPWSGAWSPGPRYQLPVMPLVLLALGCAMERWSDLEQWKRLGLTACIACGILAQIPLVATSYNDTLVLLQVITGGQYAWGFWFFDPDYMPLLWQSSILASALARITGNPSLLPSPAVLSVDRPGQPIDQIAAWFAHVPPGSGWFFIAILLLLVSCSCLICLLRIELTILPTKALSTTKRQTHATIDIGKG